MSENPYRAPGAELTEDGDVPPVGTHVGWKIFFWITLVLLVLAALGVPFMPEITPFDWIDLATSVGAQVGLGGLAFQKRVGARRFWVVFFALCMPWSIFYTVVLPLLGVPLYGQVMTLDISFAISIAFTILILFALYAYAMRAEHLWRAEHPSIQR